MADTATRVNRAVLRLLMEKVADDRYPSATMLNMIEEMLRPEDVETYAALLLEKVQGDRFPSITMLRRVRAFAA